MLYMSEAKPLPRRKAIPARLGCPLRVRESSTTATHHIPSTGRSMALERLRKRAFILLAATARVQRCDASLSLLDNDPQYEYKLEPYLGRGYGEEPTQFKHPTFITTLPSGSLVVSDSWNHRLKVMSPYGELLRTVGSFGNGTGMGSGAEPQFYQPNGLACNNWSLFVVDTMNHRVQKLKVDTLSPLASAGSYGSGPGQLSFPRGIALFNGTLYVADSNNNRIVMFSASTMSYKGSFGTRGVAVGKLSHPEGLVFNQPSMVYEAELFVADSGNDRIQVFDQYGRFLRTFGSVGEGPGQFSLPTGLAFFNGKLYVGEFHGGRVQLLSTEGRPLQTLDLGPAGRIAGLCVSKVRGAVYAVDEEWAIIHTVSFGPRRAQPAGKVRTPKVHHNVHPARKHRERTRR